MSVPETPKQLGLPYKKWRPNQRELIENILNSDRKIALVEAPTGSGKSAVAAALSLLSTGRTLILTKTKQLQDQYLRDFHFMRTLQGKSDFSCILPEHTDLPVADAPCQTGWTCTLRVECPFYIQQRRGYTARVVVSNYSKALSSYIGEFDTIICDEGHLLEKQLLSAHTIKLNYDDFRSAGYYVLPFASITEASIWGTSTFAKLDREITGLRNILSKDPRTNNPNMRLRYKTIQKVLPNLHQLSQADTGALWSIEPYRRTMYLRPLWASDHSHKLFDRAKKVVIQSATILDGNRLAKLLGIQSYEYFSIPSSFAPERMPIFYAPSAKLGMNSSSAETNKLLAAIDRVLDHYPRQRGIIHTVNMTLTVTIGDKSKHKRRLIVQRPGVRRGDAIDKFLSTPYSVLVSPSVMTGLDGKFDKARFQILAKMPFENQGDKTIAERLEQDEQWYVYQTAFNLQQMAGRVMRDESDYGETWILDEHFGWFIKKYFHLFSPWFKEALKRRALP